MRFSNFRAFQATQVYCYALVDETCGIWPFRRTRPVEIYRRRNSGSDWCRLENGARVEPVTDIDRLEDAFDARAVADQATDDKESAQ